MKHLSEASNFGNNILTTGFEFLNESEMQSIRGGVEPTKPISRPRDIYDFEEE